MATNQRTIDLLIRAKLQGVRDIAEVAKSVDTLSETVSRQSKEVIKTVEAFDQLKATRGQLSDLSKEIGEVGKLTQAYERQQVSLDKNEAKLKQQEASLASLNEQISKSNSVSQTKIEKQASLTQAIERTRNAIVQDKKVLVELSETLSKAGINTNNYAETNEKLKHILDKVTTAAVDTRTNIEKVNQSQQNGIKLQRTSLDLYQRIRGQVMSVTATYFGLYGAINLVNESIEEQGAKESVIAQLAIATGDAKSATKEYEYLVGQAQRLGLEIKTLAPGFAKLSTSMALSGKKTEEIRFVFESFAETSRALKLSNEQVDRGVYAISQIFSKGKVMAEEFNGQLGDLLPGLQGIAKEATKDKFKDFNDAMKDGKVTLNDFIGIIGKYRQTIQGPLAQAMKSVQADQARLNNEITFFKQALAENGVSEEYRKLIVELTAFFKSDDGKKFATDLADIFRLVAQVLQFVVKNFDILFDMLATVVTYKAITGIGKELMWVVGVLGSMPTKFNEFSAFLVKWGKKLAVFGRGGIVGLVVFGSVTLAGLLYEQVPEFKSAIDYIVKLFNLNFGGSISKTFSQAMVRSAMIAKKASLTAALGYGGINQAQYDTAMVKVDKEFAQKSREIWKSKPIQKAPGATAKTSPEVVTPMPALSGTNPPVVSETAVNKAKTLIESIGTAVATMEQRVKTKTADTLQEKLNALNTEFVQIESKLSKIGNAKVRAGLQKRLVAAREQLKTEILDDYNKTVAESLDKLDAQVQKKTADTLEQKINAIEQQYGKLATDIEQVVDETLREQYGERLVRAREQLKLEVIEEFQGKLLASKNTLEQDILNAEAESGRKSKLDLDARLSAIDAKYADSFKRIADYRKQLEESSMADPTLNDQENRLVLAVKENKELETRKFYLEEAARLEKVVSDIVQARNAKLQAIENQKDTGALTELQALQETARVVAESQPKILEAAQAFQLFVSANNQAFGEENQQQIDEYLAKIQEAVTSSGKLRTELLTVRDVNEKFAQGGSQVLDSFAQGLGNVIAKTGTLSDAIQGARNTFLSFAADFLREIAMMIAKQAILNALKSSGSGSDGGISGFIASTVSALVKHSGGVVGPSASRTRSVPGVVFNNAPRYHSGGMAGLRQDEYATILQKNEEVLSASDPRNITNMSSGSQKAPVFAPTNIVAIDPKDVQNAAFGSGADRQLMNIINANPSAFRAALGVR